MYGAVADHRYDMPITAFCEYIAEHPADVDGTFRARITSIVQAGDAAAASMTEENHLGTLTFVNFFTLCRSDGRWRIANKTFAHTGGDMSFGTGATASAATWSRDDARGRVTGALDAARRYWATWQSLEARARDRLNLIPSRRPPGLWESEGLPSDACSACRMSRCCSASRRRSSIWSWAAMA